MRALVALLAVGIIGCSQPAGHPVAHVSLSPSPLPADSSSPSPRPVASPSPSPSSPAFVDLPLTTLGFSCRLPIVWDDAQLNDMFVSFPSGTVTLDPSSHGFFYDRAVSRWLPVSVWAVSPDGASYAFVEQGNNDFLLHVVAAFSGKEAVFHLPGKLFNGQPYVFDYSADGIYLDQGFEHPQAGLWLVNPTTGSVRQISSDIVPAYSSGNGVIWTQVVNPTDPNPIASGTSLGTLPDEIDRVDLRTGAKTRWLYEPGRWLEIVGLDSNGGLLVVSKLWTNDLDLSAELLVVASPGSGHLIYRGAMAQFLGGGSSTDTHGTWIGSQRGVYLYTTSRKLEKVFNHPAGLANSCF